ncbi:MAG: GAF domain-containing sensor histidine kinase [Chloroflexi bacterium]|nr:GAF domain-containing sensor histidine kinase [Chloroflexota bacterium]
MPQSVVLSLRLVRALVLARWLVPLALGGSSLVVLAYLCLATPALADHPLALAGLLILALVGPLLLFLVFNRLVHELRSLATIERARLKQQRQLTLLNTVGAAVNQSLDLDTVLQRALDSTLDVLNLETGEVRLIENGALRIRRTRGLSAEFVSDENTVPLGYCICGKAAQRGALIAVSDLERLPAFRSSRCACEGLRTIVAVPVSNTHQVLGVIHVGSPTPRLLDADERALLTALGQHIGAAIEKAQLHAELGALNQQLETRVSERTRELTATQQELERKASELQAVLAAERSIEEKTRAHIAHDLHDGVQQLIVGALFETQAARDALTRQPDRAAAHLTTTQDLLRSIELEMRRTIYQLRPLALDEHGLVPALRECTARFERLAHIPCAIHSEGIPGRLKAEIEVAVFRIIQEALNNIEQYAQATRVELLLRFAPSQLLVQIQDNGIGFDVNAVHAQPKAHLGLIGMQERAAGIGGALEIASRPGGGTCIRLVVPLEG